MAQRGERLAETVPAGVWIGIRPEHCDELLAGMRPVGVTRQVGQKRRCLLRPESRHHHAVGLGGELPEESQ